MIADRLLPDGHLVQQQQARGWDQPPLAARTWKRPHTTVQPPVRPEDTPPRSPPASTPVAVVIWESTSGAHPIGQVGSNVASSFAPLAVGWHTTFMLENKLLPVTSRLRNWAQGEGGRIAQSLGQGLQLPEDVHNFSSESDEALAIWLQWHSIAVTSLTCFFASSFPFFLITIDVAITGRVVGLYDGRHVEGCCRRS